MEILTFGSFVSFRGRFRLDLFPRRLLQDLRFEILCLSLALQRIGRIGDISGSKALVCFLIDGIGSVHFETTFSGKQELYHSRKWESCLFTYSCIGIVPLKLPKKIRFVLITSNYL